MGRLNIAHKEMDPAGQPRVADRFHSYPLPMDGTEETGRQTVVVVEAPTGDGEGQTPITTQISTAMKLIRLTISLVVLAVFGIFYLLSSYL